jgi:hypothetical protein
VPYAAQLQKEGATPVAAIRTLLQTAHQLQTGGPQYRKAIILSLAEQYGVNLNEPFNQEMAKVEAQLANLSTEKLYGSAQVTQQVNQQTYSDFQAFASDPANEFFQQVRPTMATLIERGVAPDLRTAYQMALGMHPDVQAKMVERAVNDRMVAQKQKSAANLSVKGAPAGAAMAPVGKKSESVRDSLERILDGS